MFLEKAKNEVCVNKLELIDHHFLLKLLSCIFEFSALYVYMVRGVFFNNVSEQALYFYNWRDSAKEIIDRDVFSAIAGSESSFLENLKPFTGSDLNMCDIIFKLVLFLVEILNYHNRK